VRYFKRDDIVKLAEDEYVKAGGKEAIIEKIERYKITPVIEDVIHNFYYVYQGVYDYGDLDITLSLAMLYMAYEGRDIGKAIEYGCDYRDIMLKLAEIKYVIDYTFCDKAFDGYPFTLLVHAWLHVKKTPNFNKIIDEGQCEAIESWIYERAKLMYQDRDDKLWASFRPYDNQEIGIGACIVLSEFLREIDPELSGKFVEFCDSRIIGWTKKNGNPDDTLFYTPIWVKSMFFYSIYRPKPELLKSDNCKATFEGYLQQQPGNGLGTTYNWMYSYSYAEMMTLGAYLFKDGRYKWMANRLLAERLEERNQRCLHPISKITHEALSYLPEEEKGVVKTEMERIDRYDHVWEGLADNLFHLWLYWNDSLEPVMPQEGSMLLEKSAGNGRWPHNPEPSLPDKIVFRQGWKDDDMFVLLNLWGGQNSPGDDTVSHRYPASNEIITLVYGEPFLVQNTDVVTRDSKILREELNAFNIKKDGKWANSLKETYNSFIRSFKTLSLADTAKTVLPEYFGWTNERTCMMMKNRNGYFVVFDYSGGPEAEEGGVRWHLQGRLLDSDKYSMKLRLRDKELLVSYPHNEEWYKAVIEPNHRPIPVYQHNADWDLDLLAHGQRMGFTTVFHPLTGETPDIRCIDVTRHGKAVYPMALGVRIATGTVVDIIGTRSYLYRDEYTYDTIKTDAEVFIYRKENERGTLEFVNARLVAVKGVSSIARIKLSGSVIGSSQCRFDKDFLTIRFEQPVTGSISY
jgi:hypothetical protein